MTFNEANDLAKENILLEILSEKYAKYIQTHSIDDIKNYNSKILKVEKDKNNFIPTDCGGICTNLKTLSSQAQNFFKKVASILEYEKADPKLKAKIASAINDFGVKIKSENY